MWCHDGNPVWYLHRQMTEIGIVKNWLAKYWEKHHK